MQHLFCLAGGSGVRGQFVPLYHDYPWPVLKRIIVSIQDDPDRPFSMQQYIHEYVSSKAGAAFVPYPGTDASRSFINIRMCKSYWPKLGSTVLNSAQEVGEPVRLIMF